MAVDIVEQLRCHFADCDGTCVTVVATDEIVRLRAVLDAIDALHTPRWRNPLSGKPTWCRECEAMWPCSTHLLIHPDVPA